MRAVCWTGRNSIEVLDVPEPQILSATDAIVKVTSTAICGSDLHLYDGYVVGMKSGDILGHEFMGEVVDVGRDVTRLKRGDRVIVPFPIACGSCNSCREGLTSVCENSNPNAAMVEKLWGHAASGMFGYSHLTGGYAGGQAEYVRVPFADFGPMVIRDDTIPDDKVLFLTDIFPTGYMGAEMCDIKRGDVVAVWGAGPVGQLAMASARHMGAEKVIAIDRFNYRLEVAEEHTGAIAINYDDVDVQEVLKELTGGRGPDACIDAVGMEAHSGAPLINAFDRLKQATHLETDRGAALRQAIMSCRNGGTVSVVGVYAGLMDKFPIASFMNRSITMKAAQTHVHRYLPKLYALIRDGAIDPTFIISHRMTLDEAPAAYELFKHKMDDCMKVVLAA
jgi:threonine dehydrogenase-like Zn-dependent dehydrogenase